jgi:hypothetical protein
LLGFLSDREEGGSAFLPNVSELLLDWCYITVTAENHTYNFDVMFEKRTIIHSQQ